MRYKRSSTEDTTGGVRSFYGESGQESSGADERTLYGEPCHEDSTDCDEQSLYGEPQHETGDDEAPDIELLFARMRSESVSGPTVLSTRSDTRTTTER